MLLHFFLLLFATAAQAASAVLGIDLGTEYIKVAIAKPGSPLEIVLTKDSKRKEAAAVAFKPSRSQINDDQAFPDRLYGGDALALSARYPSDVYMNLKSVLGLPNDAAEVKAYLARYAGLQDVAVAREGDGGSTLGFKSQTFGKDATFMVEELVAMQLQNIKANAETLVGKNSHVSNVVVTYPSYFTAEEKRALELAAELAGLRVLALVSDGLAVGLNYATSRTFESVAAGGKPEYHVVYDMGAGSTTATVIRFQGKTVKGSGKKNTTYQEVQVVGTASDRSLGGDSLNDVIVLDMIRKFIATPSMKALDVPSISIRKHGKTMNRLFKDAEKMRQVLSANQAASTSFEGLFYEDTNFKYSLTRDEFEELAQGHASRVFVPLLQALDTAGLSLEDIESIILHGGMIRTPFIQRLLEQLAGGPSKIKTNVNADEAAAMGAAFKAASISPAYRVKDIRGVDVSGSTYKMSWQAEGKMREQKIFVPTSSVGVEKQVTVKSLQDTVIEFEQEGATGVPGVVSVELRNLTKSANELKDKYGCAPGNITTVFNVRLRPLDGIPELVSGSVSCVSDKASGSVLDSVKGMLGFGSGAGQQPLKEGDEDEATPLPVDDPTSSGTTVSAATSSDSSTTHASTSSQPKPTTITIPLSSATVVRGLNQPPTSELKTIQQRLAAFDTSDHNTVLRSEALNVLEAYTYRAREYLTDESFITVSADGVRSELEKQLSTISEWLYGDGVDAKLEDFTTRLTQLKELVDPALNRKKENTLRPAAIEKLESGLSSASGMIEMVKGQIEQAAAEAAASASSVAHAATEAVSSAASSATGGDSDGLEDDPYASEGVIGSDRDAPSEVPKPYQFTAEDLSSLTKAYDAAKDWLEEKLALQRQLKPADDPAMLAADLEAKAGQLQKSVTELIMKQIKHSEKPKTKKPKSTKKPKTTQEATSTTSGEETASSASSSTRAEHKIDEL